MAKDDPGESVQEQALAAMLIDAIAARESRSQVTTLRDLHGLIDTSQPRALRLAYALEARGRITIAHDLHDVLASRLSVRDDARR